MALHDLDPSKYLRIVPYHCQQAVEKSLKGYLSYKKIKFEKNHDIASLTKLALPLDPELEKLLEEASVLNAFAIQFRYPDAAKGEPTLEDSQFSLRVAKAICAHFLSLIPRGTFGNLTARPKGELLFDLVRKSDPC